MVVLVTGALGQLGQALQYVASNHPRINFIFKSSEELDILDLQSIRNTFLANTPNFCINAAAYTAVDKAEEHSETAFQVNDTGAENIAHVCQELDVKLIHISTDFVFSGTNTDPYHENDQTAPINVYGVSKLAGENAVARIMSQYFIIRTSWLYSEFGNNFMKTMIKLSSERDMVQVVNDQVGSPTNAVDLAQALISIITKNSSNFGIYHFSNEGSCTWYEFAKEIFRKNNIQIVVEPVTSDKFVTAAKRPKFSVLNKDKFKRTFKYKIRTWEEAIPIVGF